MKPELKQTKILITGGAGFIGSNLIETLLQMDNEVVCLDNFITGETGEPGSFPRPIRIPSARR